MVVLLGITDWQTSEIWGLKPGESRNAPDLLRALHDLVQNKSSDLRQYMTAISG